MTVSTHVYSAAVIGSPDVALRLKGGSITLDDARAPHVEAKATIAIPSDLTLALLDPRQGKRVRVSVAATYPTGTVTRTFDLGIRDRDVAHARAEVTLRLASDEAILEDTAPLADDAAPLGYQGSLRGLVNYVLNRCIPGAAVNVAGSAPDVAVPALAASQNLIRNSRAGTNLTDFSTTWTAGGVTTSRFATGGPSYAPTYVGMQASAAGAAGAYLYITEGAISIAPGKLYEMSVDVRAHGARQMQLDAILFDAAGNVVAYATPTIVTPASAWSRISTAFVGVGGVAKIRPRVTPVGGLAGNEYADATAFRLSESTGDHAADILYYDGDTADTAQYDYSWAQGAHSSLSIRKPLTDAATPDSLTWKAGQSALDFLVPILQRFGLRPVCDETRTWTLRNADYTADGSVAIRHGVNLIDGSDAIKLDEGLWFDAQVTRYAWTDASGVPQKRTDSYSLTATPRRVNTVDVSAAYPGPGRSQYAVQRAQGQGRTVTATAVADWRARAEMWSEFYLVGAPTQLGKASRVAFDLDRDRMTITSRTIDTPASAWLLIPAGQKWTDSPVGGSWTGEVI